MVQASIGRVSNLLGLGYCIIFSSVSNLAAASGVETVLLIRNSLMMPRAITQ